MSDIKFQVRVSLAKTDIKKSLIFVNSGTHAFNMPLIFCIDLAAVQNDGDINHAFRLARFRI